MLFFLFHWLSYRASALDVLYNLIFKTGERMVKIIDINTFQVIVQQPVVIGGLYYCSFYVGHMEAS